MRWQIPRDCFGTEWKVAIAAGLAFGVASFFLMWAGYNNGPIAKFWGDPISFHDALLNIPGIAVMLVGVGVPTFVLAGLRSTK